MLNSSLQQAVLRHWRVALMATASVGLSACVAKGGNESSSSEAVQSSSIAVESSSVAVSSVAPSSEAVSSVAVSSVASSVVVVPSSVAVSSSSVVESSASAEASSSSAAVDCVDQDQVAFDSGAALYAADCKFCHGDTTDAGVTAGAAVPAGIDVGNAPYGKTDNPLLAGYIVEGMAQHLPNTCSDQTECAEQIAHYLKVATKAVTECAAPSSSSVVSSSSVMSSSSVASSAPAQTITRPGYTVENIVACTANVNAAQGVVLLGGNERALAQNGFSKMFNTDAVYQSLALGQSASEYKVENITLQSDASCDDVQTWSGVLLKKYANWDAQHSNGLQTTLSKAFSDIESVVIEMKVNTQNTLIATPGELDATYGNDVDPINALDRGNAAFAIMLANNDDGANGVNAEKYIEITPSEFDQWVTVTIPLDQMDIIKYQNYGTSVGDAGDLTGQSVAKVFLNPETRGETEDPLQHGSVVRNFIASWDEGNPPTEIFKEMSVSIKKFEVVYKDGNGNSSTANSSEQGTSSSAGGNEAVELGCTVGANANSFYAGFNEVFVTVTNTESGSVSDWSASMDWSSTLTDISVQADGAGAGIVSEMQGSVAVFTGSPIAAGQSITFKYSGSHDRSAGDTAPIPTCTAVTGGVSGGMDSSSAGTSSSADQGPTGGQDCGDANTYCENFDAASTVPGDIKPTIAGNSQYKIVSGLTGNAVEVESKSYNGAWVEAPLTGDLTKGYVKFDAKIADVSGGGWWFLMVEHDAGSSEMPDDGGASKLRIENFDGKNLLTWNRLSAGDTVSPNIYDPGQRSASAAITYGEWECYELHFDEPNDLIELYIGGSEVVGLELDNDASTGNDQRWQQAHSDNFDININAVRIGFGGKQQGRITIDNLVVSDTRIGCN